MNKAPKGRKKNGPTNRLGSLASGNQCGDVAHQTYRAARATWMRVASTEIGR
jgi:hypothetical protein